MPVKSGRRKERIFYVGSDSISFSSTGSCALLQIKKKERKERKEKKNRCLIQKRTDQRHCIQISDALTPDSNQYRYKINKTIGDKTDTGVLNMKATLMLAWAIGARRSWKSLLLWRDFFLFDGDDVRLWMGWRRSEVVRLYFSLDNRLNFFVIFWNIWMLKKLTQHNRWQRSFLQSVIKEVSVRKICPAEYDTKLQLMVRRKF